MRILHLACVYPPVYGGIGTATYDFARATAAAGFDTTVATLAHPDAAPLPTDNKTSFPKLVFLRPWLRLGHGGFDPGLYRMLGRFDLVLLHYPFFGAAEIVWLRKFLIGGPPLIIHYHMDVDFPSALYSFLSWPGSLVLSSLISRADAVTAASEDYIRHSRIGRFSRLYENKLWILPFGVDTEYFRPDGPEKDVQKTVLFVGGLDRAHYFKGVDPLIRAFASLPDGRYSAWRLVVVGDGELRNGYEALAREQGVGERVVFTGRIDREELRRHYQSASLLVLPALNRNEAFGIVLLEAMASGLPVIASDLPGVRKVFEHDREGLLFRAGDVSDLKTKLEKLMAEPGRRQAMGRNARRCAIEKYNQKSVANKLVALVNRIIESNRRI